MKFAELYKKSMELWPDVIDISDGEIAGNGTLFKNLSSVWNEVEFVSKAKGEWYDLMAWIVFGNLHDLARHHLLNGINKLKKTDVNEDKIKQDLLENLQAEDYRDMLEDFIMLNGPQKY
ncbi:MAG: hypothetical protein EOO90_17375 [Pedobacter sp.]|nr:MAG: hypothetical protein EOO90_17375 [Pedobacter sp.]